MRTGLTSYSAPDAMLRAFVTRELLRRWCNHTIAIGGGECCHATMPGLHAALEKAYKAMIIAAFTGEHPSVGQGMVDGGKTMSAVQFMLDREMTIGLESLGQPLDTSADSIGVDTILETGFGLTSSHQSTAHTLSDFRDSLWNPRIMERTGWHGWAGEETAVARARDAVDEAEAAVASCRRVPSPQPGHRGQRARTDRRAFGAHSRGRWTPRCSRNLGVKQPFPQRASGSP
jgi:trimethylamine:corrinoid methyltransferase-like protein